MNKYRYTLEKGSKKHYCPNCGKKSLKRYIDIETGNYLPEQYGRCNHENSCSPHYHLNPYLDGYAKMIWEQEQKVTGVTKVTVPKKLFFRTQPKPQPTPEPVFFDFETFKQTLQPERYEKNTFIRNLLYREQFPFEVDDVTKVIQLYRLGTVVNGYRAGAITFPFIDIKGNVRAVQVKQFDEQNHTTGTDFLHSIIEKHHTRNNKPLPKWLEAYIKQDKRITCLFGEHLLSKYPNKPVALVEAPKTAIYCWLYFNKSKFPIYNNCIWLAVGAKGYLNFDVAKILKGRFVYVLPDLSKDGSTFKEWETKVKEYESRLPGTRFIMDDLLEKYGTPEQREQGADIADVLNFDWRTIRAEPEPPQPEPEKVTKVTKVTHQQNIIFSHVEPLPKVEVFKTERIERLKKEQPQNWSNDIAELEPPKDELNKPNLDNLDTIKGNSIQTQFQTRTEPYKQMVNKSKSWSVEINELEDYFSKIELPKTPIKLNEFTTILNCELFIESHLAIVKANNGNKTFLPYLERLQEFRRLLS